ncbi:MAG: hypothetical protein ACK5L3_15745 [Oscillospiraceae bacterium]
MTSYRFTRKSSSIPLIEWPNINAMEKKSSVSLYMALDAVWLTLANDR